MFVVKQAIATFETQAEAENFVTAHRAVTRLDPPPDLSIHEHVPAAEAAEPPPHAASQEPAAADHPPAETTGHGG